VKKKLMCLGFKVSQADKCLYLKGNIFVLFYADDAPVASEDAMMDDAVCTGCRRGPRAPCTRHQECLSQR
jgi:hypothetical protein